MEPVEEAGESAPNQIKNAYSTSLNSSSSVDSGCLVHTNSSISDSSRVYKQDFELIESDGEVSQFDSLDNSEGGMSAENFNTLKKVLVAPIDPPPEFQDSPQTTMLRRNHTATTCAKGYHDFAQLLIKDILGEAFLSILQHNPRASDQEDDGDEAEESPSGGGHQYLNTVIKRTRISHSVSDPQLNHSSAFVFRSTEPTAIRAENIYDEPSDSTRNSDDIEVDYYISKQLSASLARKKSSTLSANSQRLRPNSGNSLQSRLSSSHNSLAMTGTSKVDDTTFITQAMSHDPLMSRQSIIDFYNVPLDSDIYALPVDVVMAMDSHPDQQQQQKRIPRKTTHHSRRFKFPSNGAATAGGRVPLLGVTGGSPNVGQYMAKSSEAKRRLFRKAQTAAAANSATAKKMVSGSQSQLAVNNSNNNNCSNLTVISGVGGGSSSVNAKRFSAPDGLAVEVTGVKHTKKRGKREKRNSSSSASHQQATMTAAAAAASDSSDEAKRKEKAGSSSTTSNSKPLTVTLSKPLNKGMTSTTTSGGGGGNKERDKKTTIPISTSFTMQPVAVATENGKTTKREARDATKRGHNQFSTNLKQKFCSIFRFRNHKSSSQLAEYEYNDSYGIASGGAQRSSSNATSGNSNKETTAAGGGATKKPSAATIMLRALPPLPKRAPPVVPVSDGGASSGEANRRRPPAELPPPESSVETDSNNNDVLLSAGESSSSDHPPLAEHETGRVDFASNLETIKRYGWYWGPISCQAAEKILSTEPDGSFIVRDSSDDHYIFSLTFKLNSCVRHVRIEQDKGTFSFGTLAKFKARTIVEFIEQALEYSRSGRYLFFLHRRPEHGPMRVQLKNPVSRFKHIQSLQHMCRFVIMKAIVRKDLISSLPLPNRLKDYLSYKNCYTEHFIEEGNGEGEVPGPAVGGGDEVGVTEGDPTTTSGEGNGN